ncbi:MAG: ROK family protein [candidate division KSB1 bacterium]|nr:ROK family protein [candidate division KSB1 bacterium]
MALAIGVDLGGTKIGAAVIDEKGRMVGELLQRPTGAERAAEAIVADIARVAEGAALAAGVRLAEVEGVGVGAPGPLDLVTGTVLTPPNLRSLHHFPLAAALQERVQKPVRLNNDGNCFALGEALYGAGRGCGIVCGVTLGTGFGGGIVIEGALLNGATGTAAELWMCPFKDGRFEDYGSSRGLAAAYARLTGARVPPSEVFLRAKQGETQALQAWQDYGADLGVMLSYVVNTLDPDVVVVGGSVSEGWEFFCRHLLDSLRQHVNPLPAHHVQVRKAALGNLAGVVGAAALVWQHKEEGG